MRVPPFVLLLVLILLAGVASAINTLIVQFGGFWNLVDGAFVGGVMLVGYELGQRTSSDV